MNFDIFYLFCGKSTKQSKTRISSLDKEARYQYYPKIVEIIQTSNWLHEIIPKQTPNYAHFCASKLGVSE